MKYIFPIAFFALSSISVHAQVNLENDATPARSVSVQPMDNDFTLKAGETKEFRLFISNKLDKKMAFNVYLSDWRRDTLGKHVYSPVGTEPNSCSRWITFDKTFIEVDTGKIGVINVKMQVPDSADAVKEMKWAMLFIQSVEEARAPEVTKEMKSQIQSSLRFGVHINQTPPSIAADRDFKLESFLPVSSEKNVFRIVGENTGKVQLTCKSYIELSALSDGKKTKLPSMEVPVFPGQKRYFDFTLPASVTKGKYTMVGVVDAGADLDLAAAQMTINVE